jgi:phosphoribosyl 1,2-cyclic phosphodiesterase
MPISFQVLASGSKGNAILIHSARTRILLDAGLSAKEIGRRLDRTPVRAEQLDAIVISHEHTDHVRGIGVLSRRFDLPVYTTKGALENLPPQVGSLASVQIFHSGPSFRIGDIAIHPFAICHDASEPVGFVFEHEATRLGVCTDLGVATQLVRARLMGCQGLVVEANHDVERLLSGPYPWPLKQRIRSRYGHLSNEDAVELLEAIHHEALRFVLMAHLSETNNHPDLVLKSLAAMREQPKWRDISFSVGKQREPGEEMVLG